MRKTKGDAYLRPAAKTTGPTGWMKEASTQAAFGPRTLLAGRLARSRIAAAVITASAALATQMARLWRVLRSDHFLFATFRGYAQARASRPARAAVMHAFRRRRLPSEEGDGHARGGNPSVDIAQHRLVAVQHDLEGTGVG